MIVYYSIFAYTCLISYIGCYFYRKKLANGPQIDDDAYLVKAEKSISLWWALASVALLVFFVGQKILQYIVIIFIITNNSIISKIK